MFVFREEVGSLFGFIDEIRTAEVDFFDLLLWASSCLEGLVGDDIPFILVVIEPNWIGVAEEEMGGILYLTLLGWVEEVGVVESPLLLFDFIEDRRFFVVEGERAWDDVFIALFMVLEEDEDEVRGAQGTDDDIVGMFSDKFEIVTDVRFDVLGRKIIGELPRTEFCVIKASVGLEVDETL